MLFLSLFASPLFASGIASNTSSAPCTNNTLETYSGNSNLAADWQPNTINLRWYNENEKLTVQQSAQSCTYDGTLTIPSTPPTRTGYTFAGWAVRVPGTYTELEYVEGGKNLHAYIDLGFPATPTMQTLLTASVSTTDTNNTSGNNDDQQIIFGASDSTNFSLGNTYAIDIMPASVLILNGKHVSGNNITRIYIETVPNTKYQYKINYPTVGTIGINDNTKTAWTNLTSVSVQNLRVFTYGDVDPDRWGSVLRMKLYSLTLWDHGDKIHDYVPARRNSDNVVGIYDTVTQTFLTSFGSGSLVAGPTVQ